MTPPPAHPALPPVPPARSTSPAADGVDSPYAWFRLLVCLLIMTIGNGGMWTVPVILPVVQAEFGIGRADAALPYTLLMIGFGFGGILMGRLADRFGLFRPLVGAALALGLGFALAGMSTGIVGFALAHGLLIGLLGSSIAFVPMMHRAVVCAAARHCGSRLR